MSFKEYLENEAYFPSPPPNYSQSRSSDLNDVDVLLVQNQWRPTSARRDLQLVDSLIRVLEHHIDNMEVPTDLIKLDFVRSYMVDADLTNCNEADADRMVYTGALMYCKNVLKNLAPSLGLLCQASAPGFMSKVDYIFTKDEETRAVVEVKSPGVLQILIEHLLNIYDAFNLKMQLGARTTAEKVINKLCLYMGAHQTEWGVLTSHDKWIFLRLHKATNHQQAYVTFSSIEEQSNNTRPFRALLGMILAAEYQINVQSHANMQSELFTITEEISDQPPSPSSSSRGSLFDSENERRLREEGQRTDPYPLRRRNLSNDMNPNIILTSSPNVTSSDMCLNLHLVAGIGDFPVLGTAPTQLWIQRLIGAGSTGAVYEANLDACGQSSQSYAIKVVTKGNSEEVRGRISRLLKEVSIYRVLEDMRENGRKVDVVPRCYGLYETSGSLLLIMDYVGEALPDMEFKKMKYIEKITIFKAISDLHTLGINHCDLSPQNVTRHSDGTYRIIDFTHSNIHNCTGIQTSKDIGQRDNSCTELGLMWRRLVKAKPRTDNLMVF